MPGDKLEQLQEEQRAVIASIDKGMEETEQRIIGTLENLLEWVRNAADEEESKGNIA